MWQCLDCKFEIADKYLHCWNCGTKHVPQPQIKEEIKTERIAVPEFASYEEIAKVPAKGPWWRGTSNTDIFWSLLAVGLFKVLVVPFMSVYGNYVLIVFGVFAVIFVLYRVFRRDPTEGVGIKLN